MVGNCSHLLQCRSYFIVLLCVAYTGINKAGQKPAQSRPWGAGGCGDYTVV